MCLLFSVRLKVTFSFVRINSCLKICCWLNTGTQLPKKTPSSIPWSFQMLHSVKYLQLYSFQTANCVTFSQRRTDRLKSYLPIRYSKFLHRIVQNAYKMFIHKNLGKRRKVEHRCFCLSLHSIFPENCPLIPDQMVAALTCNPQVRWSGNRSFLGPNVVTKTVDGLCVCVCLPVLTRALSLTLFCDLRAPPLVMVVS